jgi:hypothetical protein
MDEGGGQTEGFWVAKSYVMHLITVCTVTKFIVTPHVGTSLEPLS